MMELINVLLIDDDTLPIAESLKTLTRRAEEKGIVLSLHEVSNPGDGRDRLRYSTSDDVVLLDIYDLPPVADMIAMLRSVNPYIPIIILSSGDNLDEICHCLDLGAINYIHKNKLRPKQSKYESERAAEEGWWEHAINSIVQAAKEYQPIRRLLGTPYFESGTIVKVETRSPHVDAKTPLSLVDQIMFLEHVANNPKVGSLFPRISDPIRLPDYAKYEMPYYRAPSFRELLFDQPHPENGIAFGSDVIKQVLDTLFEGLFTQNRRYSLPEGFLDRVYCDRIDHVADNIRWVEEARSATHKSAPASLLHAILVKKKVVVGENEYRCAVDLLDALWNQPGFRQRLAPAMLSMTHGDLHFGNILVDDRLLKRLRLKFIDPRGGRLTNCDPGCNDPARDIGKLLVSAAGQYDLIHVGCLRVKADDYTESGDSVRLPDLDYQEWNDKPMLHGASPAQLVRHSRKLPNGVREAFKTIAEAIKEYSRHKESIEEYRDLWFRARFFAAFNMSTQDLGQVVDEWDCALAVHVQGIKMLNEFAEDFETNRI